MDRLGEEIDRIQKQLTSPGFLANAPLETIEALRDKAKQLLAKASKFFACECGEPYQSWQGQLWCANPMCHVYIFVEGYKWTVVHWDRVAMGYVPPHLKRPVWTRRRG